MGLDLGATGRDLGMHHFGKCWPECVLSLGVVAGEHGDDPGSG
jgi:hypothetical protein